MSIKQRRAVGVIVLGLVLLSIATFGYIFKQSPTLILATWPVYWLETVEKRKL